jgi:DNA-binding MarR family transcriptional regulator
VTVINATARKLGWEQAQERTGHKVWTCDTCTAERKANQRPPRPRRRPVLAPETPQPLDLTPPMRRVLAVLAEAGEPLWGLEIARRCGIAFGTVYALVRRLEAHGWVTVQTDMPGYAHRGPARHLYQLTPAALALALDLPEDEDGS